jgi:hypothetical protein
MTESKKTTHDPQKPDKANSFIKYSGIGIQMLVIIGLGVWGGIKLDEIITWDFPIFTLVLSLASVAIAIYHAIKDFIKFN